MDDLTPLHDANHRLIRTVDGLGDDELGAPSLLPGWSRGHVVAHLALNAEGLARAVEGVGAGEQVPVYDSTESRDSDIEELAQAGPTELRERLLASVTRLDKALGSLTDDQLQVPLARTPGGPGWAAGETPAKRRVEVEVHHADLGAGYSAADWPPDFSVHLLGTLTGRGHWSQDFVAAPAETVETWEFGEAGDDAPRVSGSAADLAWWLAGRGDGSGLTSSTGVLPEIGKW